MNTTLQNTLKSLNLNEKEILIYLQSLKTGSAPASILGKATHIQRSTAQYTCNQLVQKRLLSPLQKGNTIYYTPEPPEKLRLIINERKKQIEQQASSIEQIIQELTLLQTPNINTPKVKYFQGAEGIIEMFEDVLKDKKPLYGATRIEEKALPEVNTYIQEHYLPQRMKHPFPAWILFNDNKKSQEYRATDPKVNRISLLVPTETFPFDTCVHIYGDKTAFYSFKKNDATGVIIQNSSIKDTMMSLFRLSWETAKKLPTNKYYADIQI